MVVHKRWITVTNSTKDELREMAHKRVDFSIDIHFEYDRYVGMCELYGNTPDSWEEHFKNRCLYAFRKDPNMFTKFEWRELVTLNLNTLNACEMIEEFDL